MAVMIKNLSVILPANNEENNLRILIPELMKMYGRSILEIIVVNDNSTDDTGKAVTSLKGRYPAVKLINRTSRPGVGHAIRTGISHLSGKSRYVLLMDCDFLANTKDILLMMKYIKNSDGVVGSRFLVKNSLINYPLVKKIANRTYHLLAHLILGIPHRDLTNNFKMYKRELIDLVHPYLKSGNFAVNAELGYFPLLLRASIQEVPVIWSERTKQMGLSKFKILRVGPSYGKVLLRLIKVKYFQSFTLVSPHRQKIVYRKGNVTT